jgi:D-amino-acid dehydrogenase
MEHARHDIAIIGGGIIGLTAAELLSRDGFSVCVVEAGEFGRGASHGNCGLITPSHALPLAQPGVPWKTLRSMLRPDSAFYIKPRLDFAMLMWGLQFFARCGLPALRQAAAAKHALLALSRERLEQLIAREQLNCEWEMAGLYYVFQSASGVAEYEQEVRWLREVGIESEPLDAAQLTARVPQLRAGLAAGQFYPMDAHLRPDQLISELVRILRARGVTLLGRSPVARFEVVGDRLTGIDTPAGLLRANHYILAAGSWSPLLARQLDLTLPIQPGKGYSITTTTPEQAPRVPLLLYEPHVAITPWASGFRIGSTMEFSGYDDTLNAARLDALLRGARNFLTTPVDAAPVEERWCGWRPMTPDDLPIIGRSPRHTNLWLATGHCMLGVSNASATAELLSAEIRGAPLPIDPFPYRPERFLR